MTSDQTKQQQPVKEIKTPAVLWAQRKEHLLLTLPIQDPLNVDIKATENTLNFSCDSKSEACQFKVELNFFGEISPDAIQKHISGQGVDLVISKKDTSQPFWTRLIKETGKFPWIKTDFSKWKDEDEEDDDDSKAAAFPSQGNPFGEGFNFGEQYDEEDDDDENEAEEEQKEHVHGEHCCH